MPFQNNIFSNLTPPVSGAVLLEVYEYGEGQTNDKARNLRGQLYRHYDGSGFQQINIYDFKGNPLETEQQLLEDATISDADWSINPALNAEIFTSVITYDALNRPITQTDPGGNVHEFTYDKGGSLKKVKLNTDEYVNDIHYDAKGQRKAIWYGNGTKTSYTYDEFTFRLRRLLTVDLNNNEILQDLNYWYDPIGNITETQDDAQQTLFFNNSVVSPTQKFVYDALYRLIEAKGRELIGTADFGNEDNWNDSNWKTSHKGDGNAVQNYTQKYTYDEVGNVLELQHIAGTGSYTRTYEIDTNSNKLLNTVVGSNIYTYAYDALGNMIEMPHLNNMTWNLNNEMKGIAKGGNSTYYQYSGGERSRKFTVKENIKEERIYLGSYEIYRKYVNNVLDIERTIVHVSDDTGRIAMLEVRTVGTDPSPAELSRFIYSNQLQSASLELDENAEIISYEEYHPYGTTSYQAMNATINAVAKRYRYTGKERDEESGLYYHGARYYIPWLGRWSAVDPLESKYAGRSPYNYGFNNPVIFNDPSGMEGERPPSTWHEVGKEFDIFNEDGTNRYGYNTGYVDIEGNGNFKEYTVEKYWDEFGGNKKYRPIFYANNPNAEFQYDSIDLDASIKEPSIRIIKKELEFIESQERKSVPLSEKSFLEKADEWVDKVMPKILYKIGAEYNPLLLALTNLFSSGTGRNLTVPNWNDLQYSGGNVSGENLSLNRRVTTGLLGVTGLVTMGFGTLSTATDFILNAGSDWIDNNQSWINTNEKGGMSLKITWTMFEFIKRTKRNPYQAIETSNALINISTGEADKRIKKDNN